MVISTGGTPKNRLSPSKAQSADELIHFELHGVEGEIDVIVMDK